MSPPSTPPPVSEPKKKKPSKKKNRNKKKNANLQNEDADGIAIPPGIGTWDSRDSWANLSEPNQHADTASNASFKSNASNRQRRARGGRKPKKKLNSVNEGGLSLEDQARLEEEQLWEAEQQLIGAADESATPSALIQDGYDEQDYQGGAELQPETPHDYSADNTYEPEPQPEPQSELKKFETGIKAFNIRKADPSGGRPMGTRIQTRGIRDQRQEHLQQQSEQQQQQQHRQRQRHHLPQQQPHQQQQQPNKPPHPPQNHEQHVPPLSQTRAQTAQQNQGSESKEVSIKVDLNLEVEILLKAKIKGEIMITFLN